MHSFFTIYTLLFLASCAYALFLERWKHLWEPWGTGLEVVAGVVLTLAAPYYAHRWGLIATPLDYQTEVWRAFSISGSVIGVWQVIRALRGARQTKAEALRLIKKMGSVAEYEE